MRALLAILLCFGTGFLVACLALPLRRRKSPELLLNMALAGPLGLGVFSITYFVWRLLFVFPWRLVIADVVIFLILLLVVLWRNLRQPNRNVRAGSAERPAAPTRIRSVLSAAFWTAIVGAVFSCVRFSLASPIGGGWDAFAIWNLRARFLFRGGALEQHWRDGFTSLIPWSHPDYPLLLPASIAHFWTYLRSDVQQVPAIIGIVCTFSTVALLVVTITLLRSRTQGLIAGLLLMGTPFFLKQGLSQYADVPLAFFFLAAISMLALRQSATSSDSAGLALAGFAAGLAAWTKNEGLLFFCALLVAQAVTTFRRQGWRAALRDSAWLLAGAIPVLATLAYFKLYVATPGDLFSSQNLWTKILDPARYWLIVRWLGKDLFLFGEWALVPATIVLAVVGKLMGKNKGTSDASIATLTLALTLCGYCAVYVVTPYDLHWHLRFSLNRLFLQLWPTVLFVFFNLVRTPEEILFTKTVPTPIAASPQIAGLDHRVL